MKPVEFKEQNVILGKPESMTDEECEQLPIFTNGEQCISCWEVTEEELKEIVETKRIWVSVLSGSTQPPICLSVSTLFVEEDQVVEEIE